MCVSAQAALDTGLMLLGRSGAGKSASGNTILGRQVFEDSFSFLPVTKDCKTQSGVVSGRKVKVTDIPGLLECISTNCYTEEPAAHVFLLVVRLGRITEDDRDSVRHISEEFGSGALNRTLKSVYKLLDHSPPVLKELISMCGGGYHVFNNKDMTDGRQAEELLVKIEAIKNLNNVYSIQGNIKNVHSVKNITGEKEALYIFFIICIVLLLVDL
uniref:AIG1-type G domain-containing protein n=1 Tax=Electrophorus electricus TaxID=8005 RepID=A0A4W4H989_ELEEL